MTYCRYTPIVGDVKVYTTENGYTKRDPFLAIVGVTHISDTEVILRSAEGKFNRAAILSVFSLLIDKGICAAYVTRRKGRKMPFGDLFESREKEDVFVVDFQALRQKGIV
jgi:hypothetical protein